MTSDCARRRALQRTRRRSTPELKRRLLRLSASSVDPLPLRKFTQSVGAARARRETAPPAWRSALRGCYGRHAPNIQLRAKAERNVLHFPQRSGSPFRLHFASQGGSAIHCPPSPLRLGYRDNVLVRERLHAELLTQFFRNGRQNVRAHVDDEFNEVAAV